MQLIALPLKNIMVSLHIMSDIIFAKPRHTYDSYGDFWRLVELSNYHTIYMDEIDPQSDNLYIFSTPDNHWVDGTYNRGWPGAKARIIYWNIEFYLDVDYTAIPGVEVWCADKYFADRTHTRYVPMGSHSGLNPADENDTAYEKRYDAATLWADCERRYFARARLTENAVSIAPNGWGSVRHEILSQSRVMVCVHQQAFDNTQAVATPIATVAPQRWCLASAYRLPMITETLFDPGIFTAGYRLMCDLPNMGRFLNTWLLPENARILADFGHSLHQLLCQNYTFKKSVEANV